MRFALKELTGKAAGKAIDVATVAMRPCVTLHPSIRRDQKAYFVSGLANAAIVRHKF